MRPEHETVNRPSETDNSETAVPGEEIAIPGLGAVRRTLPIETRIDAEQVRLLLSLGEASRWTIFGAILIVGLTFFETAPVWALPAVLTIQFIAQIAFDRVRAGFRADPDAVPNAMKWAHRYALVTLISGATWGVGSILWLPGSSFAHEIFYILVLATLVMATAVSRANYPPAVAYYAIASCTPVTVMLLWRAEPLSIATVVLAAMFFVTAAGWTRRVNEGYREAFRLRFENADLVERMNRAHAASEQRRRDAEEAEARARAAMQAKQEFLDIISHEVRAPLDGLRNMAMYLADEAVNDAQMKIAASVEETSQLLRRLIDDMIDFSEIEARSLELKPRSFNPAELAAGIVRLTRHQAVARGLSLELDKAIDLPPSMVADPDRVKQVLANLVGNAIKFTYQGGVVVRVSTLKTPDNETLFRFSVTDTGPGLTEEARRRIFDAFAQGADARDFRFAGKAAGAGLGLPISERLVRMMGGHIGVDTTPGQGSTFWFLLPAGPPPISPPSEKATSRSVSANPSAFSISTTFMSWSKGSAAPRSPIISWKASSGFSPFTGGSRRPAHCVTARRSPPMPASCDWPPPISASPPSRWSQATSTRRFPMARRMPPCMPCPACSRRSRQPGALWPRPIRASPPDACARP